MKRKSPPDIQLLRKVYSYNKNTGEFRWKIRTGAKSYIGEIAGHLRKDGYIEIVCDGKRYLAHNLAWYYVHGDWVIEIDHKDKIRYHNWITNLRPCTRTQNSGNGAGWGNKKKSKLPRGVYHHPGDKTRFRAQIVMGGRAKHLGCFDTVAEAEAVYKLAARTHFGEFAS